MKTVYIVLTGTKTVLSRIIKLYTKQPYNHASFSFDPNLSRVYSFGRKVPWNPFFGGFSIENVTGGFFKYASCEIFSLQVTDEEYIKMKEFVENIEEQEKKYGYNFIGLIGVVLDRPIERKKAYFCSQFVATLLSENTSVRFDKLTGLVTPEDIRNNAALVKEYEGTLDMYLDDFIIAYAPLNVQ